MADLSGLSLFQGGFSGPAKALGVPAALGRRFVKPDIATWTQLPDRN